MGKGFIVGLIIGAIVAAMSLSVVSLAAPPVGNLLRVAGAAPEPVAVAPTAAAASNPTEAASMDPPVALPMASTDAEPAAAVDGGAAEGTGNVPQTPVVEVPAGSEFARPKPEQETVLPVVEPAPVPTTAPAVAVPMAEPVPELAERATASAPEDQSDAPMALTAPASPTSGASADETRTAGLASQPTTQLVPEPQPAPPSPDAPLIDGAISAIDTTPDAMGKDTAPPGAPKAPQVPPDVLPDTVLPAETMPAETMAVATVESPSATSMETPAIDGATDPAVAGSTAVPDAVIAETADPGIPAAESTTESTTQSTTESTATGDVTEATPGSTADTAPQSAPGALAQLQPVAEPEPVIVAQSEAEESAAATAPQPGFSASVPGVKINRLPSIGTEPAAPEPEPEPMADPATEAAEDIPAVSRYAVAVDNPDARPLVAVIILDTGPENGAMTPAELAGLGLPVTIALAPDRADAPAAIYRAAGMEVAILAPALPERATASDLEISYQSYVASLPETVALIGAPDAAFQTDRRVAQHLVALLAADGRGLVTYARGLNPAGGAAEKSGLPHASVYRLLDAENESATTIGRYLDRAAFEAAQKGQVLVALHAYPASIEALKSWASAGAKGTVIGPVSAAMLPRHPTN